MAGRSVQRQEKAEKDIQAKPEITALQRMKEPEEELQAKLTLQRREAIAVGEASTDLESTINRARGSGQPLEAGLQRSMGQAMGAEFSGVRVNTDTQADHLNQSIQAKAFTTGQDVFFRQGKYNHSSRGGQELIAHELTHVVQQTGAKEVISREGNVS
ncbi:MAG: eCIS core domain-containing protein, partial [Nostoc sp.]